jgi:hypothetical protein
MPHKNFMETIAASPYIFPPVVDRKHISEKTCSTGTIMNIYLDGISSHQE